MYFEDVLVATARAVFCCVGGDVFYVTTVTNSIVFVWSLATTITIGLFACVVQTLNKLKLRNLLGCTGFLQLFFPSPHLISVLSRIPGPVLRTSSDVPLNLLPLSHTSTYTSMWGLYKLQYWQVQRVLYHAISTVEQHTLLKDPEMDQVVR